MSIDTLIKPSFTNISSNNIIAKVIEADHMHIIVQKLNDDLCYKVNFISDNLTYPQTDDIVALLITEQYCAITNILTTIEDHNPPQILNTDEVEDIFYNLFRKSIKPFNILKEKFYTWFSENEDNSLSIKNSTAIKLEIENTKINLSKTKIKLESDEHIKLNSARIDLN